MTDAIRSPRWWWLAIPLAISSSGWAFAPYQLTSSGWDVIGAALVAGFAGTLATALTAPATIVVLRSIGAMPRLGLWQYVGIVFAIALPALTFESFDVPASAMPLFLGKWVAAGAAPFVELWFALAFIAVYALMAFATFRFARRGGVSAVVATIAPIVLIFGWAAYSVAHS